MNKYYELRQISDLPKEDGRYFVINDGGYKDMLTYENGGWIDCDMYSGDWLITDPPKFYLAPLAEPVEGMRWVKASDRLPEDGKRVIAIRKDGVVTTSTNYDMIHSVFMDGCKWLDESASSTPSAREAELERECERLKGLIDTAWLDGNNCHNAYSQDIHLKSFKEQHNL